jgi:hypothetical protein
MLLFPRHRALIRSEFASLSNYTSLSAERENDATSSATTSGTHSGNDKRSELTDTESEITRNGSFLFSFW